MQSGDCRLPLPGKSADRPVEAADKTRRDRVMPTSKTIGMVTVAAFAARAAGSAAAYDHGYAAADEIGRERRQSIELIFRIPILDRDVLTIDIADVP